MCPAVSAGRRHADEAFGMGVIGGGRDLGARPADRAPLRLDDAGEPEPEPVVWPGCDGSASLPHASIVLLGDDLDQHSYDR
jgi:hypothetical protein